MEVYLSICLAYSFDIPHDTFRFWLCRMRASKDFKRGWKQGVLCF